MQATFFSLWDSHASRWQWEIPTPNILLLTLPTNTSEIGCQYILQEASLAWSQGNLLFSPGIRDAKLNLINSILCHSYPLCSSIGTQHRGRLLYFPKRLNSSKMSTSQWPCLSHPSWTPQDRMRSHPGSTTGHLCLGDPWAVKSEVQQQQVGWMHSSGAQSLPATWARPPGFAKRVATAFIGYSSSLLGFYTQQSIRLGWPNCVRLSRSTEGSFLSFPLLPLNISREVHKNANVRWISICVWKLAQTP